MVGTNLFYGCTNALGIFRSTDFGASWANVSNELYGIDIYAFANVENYLFTGHLQGVHYSSNNGSNWIDASQGLGGNTPIRSLTVLDNYIYAGTEGHCVWRRHLGDFIPPGVPVLLYPPNHSINLPVNLNLTWSAPPYATSYHLQVATDSLFNNLIVNDSVMSDSLGVLTGLNYSTDYWWHVKAKNPAGSSAFSAAFKFTTIPAPPSAPILQSPPNNSTGQSLTPFLDWADVQGAQSYRVQVSEDTNFNNPIINQSGLSLSQHQVTANLQNNTLYYWRAAAGNTSGYGPWSSVWNFRTLIIGINKYSNDIPKEFALYKNFPNPFNPVTKIKFDIPRLTETKITIYNILGKEIAVPLNRILEPGKYEIILDASNYPSGVYFYKLTTAAYTETKKMVLVK